jgi:hypothetical protein
MDPRTLFGLSRVVFVIAVIALAVGAAGAQAAATPLNPGDTFGVTSCAQQSGISFNQSGFCVYFPDGSAVVPSICDPAFCGEANFLFPSAGTFEASVTYPSPNGFNLIALQLCHDNQTVPDPATCSQTMSPGGAGVTCPSALSTNDNGTPSDFSDDIDTYSISCPIAAGDSVNPYTLIVYPLNVLHCDAMALDCAPDVTKGVTAALSGSFSALITPTGPANGKVNGGGKVAPQQHFSLHAVNDSSKWSKTHLNFGISTNDPTRCKFVAQGATFVNVQPNQLGGKEAGGSAAVSGNGTVTDSLGVKHTGVPYTLNVTDGGKNAGDTFQLTAAYTGGRCDTNGLIMPVTQGQIDVDPDSPPH